MSYHIITLHHDDITQVQVATPPSLPVGGLQVRGVVPGDLFGGDEMHPDAGAAPPAGPDLGAGLLCLEVHGVEHGVVVVAVVVVVLVFDVMQGGPPGCGTVLHAEHSIHAGWGRVGGKTSWFELSLFWHRSGETSGPQSCTPATAKDSRLTCSEIT